MWAVWHSSVVSERVSAHAVKTFTGSTYRLLGHLNDKWIDHATFAPVVDHFRSGFPSNWVELIGNLFADSQCNPADVSDATTDSDDSNDDSDEELVHLDPDSDDDDDDDLLPVSSASNDAGIKSGSSESGDLIPLPVAATDLAANPQRQPTPMLSPAVFDYPGTTPSPTAERTPRQALATPEPDDAPAKLAHGMAALAIPGPLIPLHAAASGEDDDELRPPAPSTTTASPTPIPPSVGSPALPTSDETETDPAIELDSLLAVLAAPQHAFAPAPPEIEQAMDEVLRASQEQVQNGPAANAAGPSHPPAGLGPQLRSSPPAPVVAVELPADGLVGDGGVHSHAPPPGTRLRSRVWPGATNAVDRDGGRAGAVCDGVDVVMDEAPVDAERGAGVEEQQVERATTDLHQQLQIERATTDQQQQLQSVFMEQRQQPDATQQREQPNVMEQHLQPDVTEQPDFMEQPQHDMQQFQQFDAVERSQPTKHNNDNSPATTEPGARDTGLAEQLTGHEQLQQLIVGGDTTAPRVVESPARGSAGATTDPDPHCCAALPGASPSRVYPGSQLHKPRSSSSRSSSEKSSSGKTKTAATVGAAHAATLGTATAQTAAPDAIPGRRQGSVVPGLSIAPPSVNDAFTGRPRFSLPPPLTPGSRTRHGGARRTGAPGSPSQNGAGVETVVTSTVTVLPPFAPVPMRVETPTAAATRGTSSPSRTPAPGLLSPTSAFVTSASAPPPAVSVLPSPSRASASGPVSAHALTSVPTMPDRADVYEPELSPAPAAPARQKQKRSRAVKKATPAESNVVVSAVSTPTRASVLPPVAGQDDAKSQPQPARKRPGKKAAASSGASSTTSRRSRAASAASSARARTEPEPSPDATGEDTAVPMDLGMAIPEPATAAVTPPAPRPERTVASPTRSPPALASAPSPARSSASSGTGTSLSRRLVIDAVEVIVPARPYRRVRRIDGAAVSAPASPPAPAVSPPRARRAIAPPPTAADVDMQVDDEEGTAPPPPPPPPAPKRAPTQRAAKRSGRKSPVVPPAAAKTTTAVSRKRARSPERSSSQHEDEVPAPPVASSSDTTGAANAAAATGAAPPAQDLAIVARPPKRMRSLSANSAPASPFDRDVWFRRPTAPSSSSTATTASHPSTPTPPLRPAVAPATATPAAVVATPAPAPVPASTVAVTPATPQIMMPIFINPVFFVGATAPETAAAAMAHHPGGSAQTPGAPAAAGLAPPATPGAAAAVPAAAMGMSMLQEMTQLLGRYLAQAGVAMSPASQPGQQPPPGPSQP
ncbi:hypothetical protein AMAG_15378 [Allomyces macrogynus ATCC 38327]|uniref:SANTA domain-containing protein n=1 Tax=Allomyces macrogynus (strain ATCC 38327) TaxID=578462 RepID=A0A0L0T740_ALLM3|nr:hypothetical protein AMAG_15378 [Allomyces macrogynus ATCC 38327]|eukprot:KNE70623.1 hypothetical protein AMAG_15378 [Allomyces macrogynus ATCC 38327]